ncbi:uncharacterized protein LOC142631492 [Castanea sativa]|uniref:uncharacterized protein LOC142631492 n=1 Tax=Castanea sativa TaxID=21020 RepID=UPI003F650984
MAGDPMRCNQNLHCHYHQEMGHTTEDCRTLWNHLEQLVKEGRLKQFLYRPNGQGSHSGVMNQGSTLSRPPLGFSKDDKIGTIQPHDDTVVVTLRIGGYDVRRVMVDQGSGADIMYLDLFKGLNLKLEDLAAYDLPLISFEGKAVIPKGQIRSPVQLGPEVVDVDFIVVDAYSPYTVIVARPWLHALGAVSSTLHVKIKFPSGDQIEKLLGS